MTPFETWFDKEYGTRPSARSITELEVDAEVYLDRYKKARDLLTEVIAWEGMKEAALAAWQVRE